VQQIMPTQLAFRRTINIYVLTHSLTNLLTYLLSFGLAQKMQLRMMLFIQTLVLWY